MYSSYHPCLHTTLDLLLQEADDRPQFKTLSSSLSQMNSQHDDDYSETVDD